MLVPIARAEDASLRMPENCLVNVRVIKGSRRTEDTARRELNSGAYLTDVKSQLEAIPFSSFRVVDSAEKKVKLGETGDFTLVDSGNVHNLSIKPCTVSGERIRLSVDWSGPSGEPLLSTKLGVIRGKTVVVGEDSTDDSSTIMCIRVDCS